MDWQGCRKQFGENLCAARERAGQTQKELAELVSGILDKKVGRHAISDFEINKRENPPSQKMIDAFLKALEIKDRGTLVPWDEDGQKQEIQPFQVEMSNYLKTKGKEREVAPFLGSYYCLFHSTDSKIDCINRGKLELRGKRRSCSAQLELYNRKGRCIKHYKGVFFLNTHFETCNILLCGNTFEEICMIIAPMAKPSVGENQFIFGLALTSAAGINKRPTAHRILFYRKKISPEAEKLISSQLLLNTDIICLTSQQLKELRNAAVKAQRDYSDSGANYYKLVEEFCDIIESRGAQETIYKIEESLLFDIRDNGSLLERSQATAFIRTYSMSEYYNKIGKSSQELLNEILEWGKEDGTKLEG